MSTEHSGKQNNSKIKQTNDKPVGKGDYIVKHNDCLISIAYKHRIPWKKIWDHPNNRDLRERRKDPNMLFPGDRLVIPRKEEKFEPCPTEKHHKFLRKGIHAQINVKVFRRNQKITSTNKLISASNEPNVNLAAITGRPTISQPRKHEPYMLKIGGRWIDGTTGDNGEVSTPIRGDEEDAILIVGNKLDVVKFELKLGVLAPSDTILGVQQRLNNLGYEIGPCDGVIGPRTEGMIRLFQRDNHMKINGHIDSSTTLKIKEFHGS